MTKIEKLISKFFNNPKSLNYKDIDKALIHLEFIKINAKGSHIKFKHPRLKNDLIIPVHNNNCKDFYKILASKTAKIIYKS